MKQYILKRPDSSVSFKVDYRSELNDEQYSAVTADGGPILVIAGAGSGKTRTITYRVAWLIESGIRPNEILLVTFTNKAAREMLQRVESLTGLNLSSLWGGTYHHIANLVLRRHANLLGYSSDFTILDTTDTKDLIEMCIDELKIDTKKRRFPRGEVLRELFSYSINTESPLEKAVEKKAPYFLDLVDTIKLVKDYYNNKKKAINSVDFDDLLINFKKLLDENQEIYEKYSSLFKYILVDEYQDTNKLQADLIDKLASKHRNLLVVGDDSQSIYSFRGANFTNIITFTERYPDAKIYKLETNYRSTPQILTLANSSIKYNKKQYHKTLRAVQPGYELPAVVPVNDVYEQAEFVAHRILELRDEGVSLHKIAVLYRAHFHSMELQLELTRRNIPFFVRSGLRFFEQAHVKDIVSFLRLTINPKDELSLKRALKLFPGVGKSTAEKLWEIIAQSTDPASVLLSEDTGGNFGVKIQEGWLKFSEIYNKLNEEGIKNIPSEQITIVLDNFYSDYLYSQFPNADDRQHDIEELSGYAKRFPNTAEFLSQLSLLSELTGEDIVNEVERDEAVTLTTIHQAKGLEWEHVFIIWLSEGRMPSPLSLNSEEELEEERRLFYVGVTRARKGLYLIYPRMIEQPHRTVIAKPSRFLMEIDRDTYEIWRVDR
jgi:DNA helicase-2/ATP-dependent DNA helicase PcrA